ncbi:hypothetical protein [Erwinia sp. Leaf53]|uniref:hypothetical protein n=1 Tax=Erwinia sp. Leaf53 TaxID=1736225 RepID=UPI0006F449CE|nr:hypothetical protein [Erwinia sp. Leaf53]KQN56744.1 hypothetical protein ASF13_06380 [Erwinia sp. Leaf53]
MRKIFTAILLLLNASAFAATKTPVKLEKMQAVFECAGLAGEGHGLDSNGENVRDSLALALIIYKKNIPDEMLLSYQSHPDKLATDFALFYQQFGVTNAVVLISESLKKKGIVDYGDNHIREARHLWDARRCNLIIRG